MKFLGVEIRAQNTTLSLFDETEVIPERNAIMLVVIFIAIKKKDNKDKGQRTLCGCMVSKDIEPIRHMSHQCEYCYANTSKELALVNYKAAKNLASNVKQ